ncbi:uncharacterized protein LOC144712921 [Wolffia australiana]
MQEFQGMAGAAAVYGGGEAAAGGRRLRPPPQQNLRCPRCDSSNTKFCYYNNYNISQPRHLCKSCRRYWTRGGVLRNVPVGGGCRKPKRSSSSSSSALGGPPSQAADPIPAAPPVRAADPIPAAVADPVPVADPNPWQGAAEAPSWLFEEQGGWWGMDPSLFLP